MNKLKPFLKLLFLFSVVLKSSSSNAQYNWTKLSADLLNAFHEVYSNDESLDAAQKMVEDIQAGKHPAVPGIKWTELSDK